MKSFAHDLLLIVVLFHGFESFWGVLVFWALTEGNTSLCMGDSRVIWMLEKCKQVT